MLRSRRRSKLRRAQRKEEKSLDLSDRLITTTAPASAAAEAYRALRTNLFYALVDQPPKVIVLTSPSPREGKSTTVVNLGIVLAQANKSVLLLDCDLRKPVIHKIFGLRNIQGMVDVVVGERSLQEVWHEPLPGLKVVTAGPIPPNPAEILSSRRFTEFLSRVRDEFDYVLIDVPPVELVSDPLVLATQGDGVLLVLDAQSTRKGTFRHSLRSLETVGANVLGTVMNNVNRATDTYYYGGDYVRR